LYGSLEEISGKTFTLVRADPIGLVKAAAAMIGGSLLVAFLFHDLAGMPFWSVLLIGWFVVPPALAAMLSVLLIARWIGMRVGAEAGRTLALSLPFALAAAAGGLALGFFVLLRILDYPG
jgi:hypothetical protein